MSVRLSRQSYSKKYGPTVGDRIRLADTELVIEVEHDYTSYGEEAIFGGGKSIRDGQAQCSLDETMSPPHCDLVITNAVIIDHWGIVKGDIGIRDGRIVAVGKSGNPLTQCDVDPRLVIGPGTEIIAGEGKICTAGGIDTQNPQNVSTAIQLLLLVTVLSMAPAILVMVTSFTRIIIVLSLVRNAIGIPQLPPNQVMIGLALFLTAFVMAPAIKQINNEAVQPYLNGTLTQQEAFDRGEAPLRTFMLKQTREQDLGLFLKLSGSEKPETIQDVPTYVLVPAFTISELKTAFQMGFVMFVPFLIIDLIVSSALLSMGMMMLPPVIVSLPFKILLFVLVDGWYLIIGSLVGSFAK